MIDRSVPLVPKNPDGPLMVLVLGRVSTKHQDVKNIEASYEDVERFLKSIYDGPTHLKHLGEQGSGMLVDRVSIVEAEQEIETGLWDLVLMEDLSKAYRNPRHQYAFVQNCVDAETRVICTGDNLDTADSDWEVAMGSAALRHGLHIPDTRRRVRRTATYAFHNGGMVQKVRFGYRKLTREEAASGQFGPQGLRIEKVSEATVTFDEIRARVHNGAGLQDITQWLNAAGVKPGPYVKKGYWSRNNVEGLLYDPILSGMRTFRKQKFRPIYRTGRHLRTKNQNPEREYVAQLAHMTVDEQKQMIAELETNSHRTHNPTRGRAYPLNWKSRRDSIFPAQHADCAVCGERMHRVLHDQLKCRRAYRRTFDRCWNHVQVQCEVARTKIFTWFFAELEKCPQQRTEFLDSVWFEQERELARRREKLARMTSQIGALERASANLAAAIAAGDKLEPLLVEMRANEAKLKNLRNAESEENQCLREEFTLLSREELDQRPLEGTLAVAPIGRLRCLSPTPVSPASGRPRAITRPRTGSPAGTNPGLTGGVDQGSGCSAGLRGGDRSLRPAALHPASPEVSCGKVRQSERFAQTARVQTPNRLYDRQTRLRLCEDHGSSGRARAVRCPVRPARWRVEVEIAASKRWATA